MKLQHKGLGFTIEPFELSQEAKDSITASLGGSTNNSFTTWQKNLSDAQKAELGIVVDTQGTVSYIKPAQTISNTNLQTDTGLLQTPKITSSTTATTTTAANTTTSSASTTGATTATPRTTPDEKKWIPGLENWQTGVLAGLALATVVTTIVLVTKDDKPKKKKRK